MAISFKDFSLTDLYESVVDRWNALKKRTVYVAGDDADLVDGMVMLRNNRLEQYSASTGTWSEYIPKATGKYDINVDQLDGYDADHFASVGSLAAKEPVIAAGAAGQYYRGDKSWADFATGVRAAALSGLSTASSATILATDTVLSALGKLQAQVSGFSGIRGGNFGGYVWFANGSTLAVADAGKVFVAAAASVASVYMPSAASLQNGDCYRIINHLSTAITVYAQSGQQLWIGGSSVASFVIPAGKDAEISVFGSWLDGDGISFGVQVSWGWANLAEYDR
jgi:hypothetical protein